MKCKSAQEQMHSLVGGELPAWEAWRVKRHCASCPACQAHREQAERMSAGLREMASAATPERVRAAVFAQLPAIETHQSAVYHMQVSMGQDAKAQRRYAFRRLVRLGGVTAAIGMSGLLIAPHIIPGFPDAGELFGGQQHTSEPGVGYREPGPEKFLEKAKQMRERWKPWAIAHKPLMQQMLWGDKQGFAALLRIYRDLPAVLPENGVGLTYQDIYSGGMRFTWQPTAKLSMSYRYNTMSRRYPGKQEHYPETMPYVSPGYFSPQKMQPGNNPKGSQETFDEQMIKTLKQDYDSHSHDLELSRSISTSTYYPSSTTYCSLWVSGRVSETTQKLKQVGGRWEPSGTIYREICPPYEELTR